MVRAANVLVKAMESKGVEVIFGIPGGSTLPFYDALYDSSIRTILMRHEQQAAHAAEGYARVKGRPGLVTATSGPGATNLLTGIANAMMDSQPVIAITGQVTRDTLGTDAFQETDITGILLPVTKYAVTVKDPSKLAQAFVDAYHVATAGRPGPVLIDVPRDVFQADVEPQWKDEPSLMRYVLRADVGHVGDPDPGLVSRAAEILMNAEKPVIVAGGGVIISNATEELVRLAEYLMAPVVVTTPGIGSIPSDHPLMLGVIGMHGRVEANLAMIESDTILAVGVRFSDRSVGRFDDLQKDRKIIHVDIDASELGKNVMPTVSILGDAKRVLSEIYACIVSKYARKEARPFVQRLKAIGERFDEFMNNHGEPNRITSWRALKVIREELPRNAIVTTGVGQHQMWVQLCFKVFEPRTLITSCGLGTMGFGLPAAVGAKVAAPERTVACIDGDGSFTMTCQSLIPIAQYDIPVVCIIFDNKALGMIRQWQDIFYQKRYKDECLEICLKRRAGRGIDYVKLAESMGVEGAVAESLDDLRMLVRRAVRSEQALVIDLPIDREEKVLPMVPPGKWLSQMITPPGFEIYG
ncbi:MAG: acetolactate synthase, large subunit, biosynthetic type [Candidatus Terraquivivens tikiterensis]|uniref:Acetolactate synthase n=1 Tax=Candidatus Terraquivivens tikiterensis TaxID=1980982 RepID=A0A2R7YBU8_9ARCH|nr:MAG: acetolactate synthase, large subunit, biosynthetic type [Candidatus Terraquivivens tikiterensis]